MSAVGHRPPGAGPESEGGGGALPAPTMGGMTVRVRFAPSPTGSLHLGNALSAVANRGFADAQGGVLLLRIDDTDPARVAAGGEDAIVVDLAWLEVGFDEGPVRQSERGALYVAASEEAARNGAVRDPDGSLRLDGTTLVRADGTATYQLATVVDDLELGITHVIRGADHRSNEDVQQRIAVALGGRLPEVIHHGLLLGDDGKKLSKRHGHASVADLREEGIPAAAVRAYLQELGLPAHDVRLDLPRLHRLAIDAIAAMSDDELASAAGAPPRIARALRGARTLVEAREIALADPRAGARHTRRGDPPDARAVRRAARRGAGRARRGRRDARSCVSSGGRREPEAGPTGADRRRPRPGAVDGAHRARPRRGTEPRGASGADITGTMAVRLYDTVSRELAELPPPPATGRHVRLRPDRLPARPHRERAPVRRLRLAARTGCASVGTR